MATEFIFYLITFVIIKGCMGSSYEPNSQQKSLTKHIKTQKIDLGTSRYHDYIDTARNLHQSYRGPQKCDRFCKFCDCYMADCDTDTEQRTIEKWYKGLFMSKQDLISGIEKHTKYAEILQYETLWTSSRAFDEDICCPTEWHSLAPMRVYYMNITYEVVQHVDTADFQIITEGRCRELNQPCGAGLSGRCVEETRFQTWVLVHMPEMESFRFVPVTYPRTCKCIYT